MKHNLTLCDEQRTIYVRRVHVADRAAFVKQQYCSSGVMGVLLRTLLSVHTIGNVSCVHLLNLWVYFNILSVCVFRSGIVCMASSRLKGISS